MHDRVAHLWEKAKTLGVLRDLGSLRRAKDGNGNVGVLEDSGESKRTY